MGNDTVHLLLAGLLLYAFVPNQFIDVGCSMVLDACIYACQRKLHHFGFYTITQQLYTISEFTSLENNGTKQLSILPLFVLLRLKLRVQMSFFTV